MKVLYFSSFLSSFSHLVWSIPPGDGTPGEGGCEGVVAPCCNPLTLQPEQSGGRGSNPISTFESHDKGSQTRLALSYFCDPSA